MFKKITPFEIQDNVFELIRHQACVVNFGSMENHNGLAVGWALMGSLWRMEVASVFIKPNRYSFTFSETSDYFSIIWFDKERHDEIIKFFGSKSGRDVNKEKELKLTPMTLDNSVCYEEARLIITCKKIYSHALKEEEIKSLDVLKFPMYEDKKFHTEYIGQILNVYVKER